MQVLPRVHMKLNKEPKEIYPSFYIVTLRAANKETKTMCMYTNFTVAHTPEDAIEIVTATLEKRDTDIFNEGVAIGGWQYAHHHAIPAERLEEMFNEVGTKVKEVKEVRKDKTKNELMQQIIETRDAKLLDEQFKAGLLTDAEAAYLQEKIT